MEELPRKENKMGVLPVGRLILTMSAPMVLSMLFQALYNVVDSVFVARLGQDAMNAVSLAFPLQTVLIGVSVGTGVGMNSLISRRLGENRLQEAESAANNGLLVLFLTQITKGEQTVGTLFEIALKIRKICLQEMDGLVEASDVVFTLCLIVNLTRGVGFLCQDIERRHEDRYKYNKV
jgi:hypothetical protein